MTTIISSNFYLTSTQLEDNAGIIGYKNLVTPSTITATSEVSTNPITNAANPATAWGWNAANTSDQTITINTQAQEIDYIGIAKHNLNQIGLTLEVKYNGVTVVEPQPVSSKQALLFLNNLASPDTVELIIRGATTPPRIAVLYIGKALRLQRNIYVGHTPINYGRDRTSINGVSENGQYLGEIVVRETNTTSVNLQNLDPDWYRTELDPFFALKPRPPCFWAWRPSKYPAEVGYAWIEDNPSMSNQRANGMVQASWNFRGIV